jgi:fluoroquinolone transport system permease protein
MFRDLLKADLKLITIKPILLSLTFIPFLLVLIVKFIYSLIPDLIISGSRLQPENYLTLLLITVISSVPIVAGIVMVAIFDKNQNTPESLDFRKRALLISLPVRMSEVVLLSFVLVLLSIIVTDPVPDEGWLRTLYVTVLLALQSPLIYLIIANRTCHKAKSIVIYYIGGFFLIAVPVGLLLSYPWNLIAYLSPLYWISWGWVTSTKVESIFCGALSVIMMLGPVLTIYRILLIRKSD